MPIFAVYFRRQLKSLNVSTFGHLSTHTGYVHPPKSLTEKTPVLVFKCSNSGAQIGQPPTKKAKNLKNEQKEGWTCRSIRASQL